MAFSDPITITINAVAHVLGRVSTNGTSAVYSNADGTTVLNISHQITKDNKIRSLRKLETKKVVADPLTEVNDYGLLTTYSVTERPMFGFSSTEVKNQQTGFNNWDNAGATQDKLYGRES